MPSHPVSQPSEAAPPNGLMILSEMGRYLETSVHSWLALLMTKRYPATGSPRTRVLASLNITPEDLVSYTADMRSFLDHDHPDENEEEGKGDRKPSREQPPTSPTQTPATPATPPAEDPSFVSGLLTPPLGSPARQKPRSVTPDRETASSKTEATTSRAGSSKAESSSTASLVHAPAPESDAPADKPKPKLKIKLLPPNASSSTESASTGGNVTTADGQKVLKLRSVDPKLRVRRVLTRFYA